MIKLVACDVDGTLLKCGETEPSERVLSAIVALKEAGKTVAIASGRTYGSLIRLFDSVKENVYFICCDGATTVYNGKVIYTKQIGIGDVLDLIRREEYDDASIMLCCPERSYVIKGSDEIFEAVKRESADVPEFCARLYDLKEPVVKIAIYSKNKKARKLQFFPKSLRVAYSSDEWCEYTSAISNKGLAISDLQTRLYLSKFDTLAIGDGENDVEMLKKAKIAVSANNAHSALSDVAGEHTDDVAEYLFSILDK